MIDGVVWWCVTAPVWQIVGLWITGAVLVGVILRVKYKKGYRLHIR